METVSEKRILLLTFPNHVKIELFGNFDKSEEFYTDLTHRFLQRKSKFLPKYDFFNNCSCYKGIKSKRKFCRQSRS